MPFRSGIVGAKMTEEILVGEREGSNQLQYRLAKLDLTVVCDAIRRDVFRQKALDQRLGAAFEREQRAQTVELRSSRSSDRCQRIADRTLRIDRILMRERPPERIGALGADDTVRLHFFRACQEFEH
jgi:hypothetical protein